MDVLEHSLPGFSGRTPRYSLIFVSPRAGATSPRPNLPLSASSQSLSNQHMETVAQFIDTLCGLGSHFVDRLHELVQVHLAQLFRKHGLHPVIYGNPEGTAAADNILKNRDWDSCIPMLAPWPIGVSVRSSLCPAHRWHARPHGSQKTGNCPHSPCNGW